MFWSWPCAIYRLCEVELVDPTLFVVRENQRNARRRRPAQDPTRLMDMILQSSS